MISLSTQQPRSKNVFKYCNMWALHPQFKSIVTKAWYAVLSQSNNKFYSVTQKLKVVKRALSTLHKHHFATVID